MARSYENATRAASWTPVGLLPPLDYDEDADRAFERDADRRSHGIRGGSILDEESLDPITDAVLEYHLSRARECDDAGDTMEAHCQEQLAADRRAELARKAVRRG